MTTHLPSANVACIPVRPLANTGLSISAIAFGAGPVSGLMTSANVEAQRATVARALERGINWFDTAATYGAGRSEETLGKALHELGASDTVHVATKVRLNAEDLGKIREAVTRSVTCSLKRLRLQRVTLLQLHNSITSCRGDAPTSITPLDVLGPGGVVESFEDLRQQGLVQHFGLTGLGQRAALAEVVREAAWTSIQINEHALLHRKPGGENFLAFCAAQGLAVLAIRVFAGGALSLQPPSAHTLKTPFFPLAIYERDSTHARSLARVLPPDISLPEVAIRHAVGHPHITSAIVGFATPGQVDETAYWAGRGPLPQAVSSLIHQQPLPEEDP